MVRSRNIVTTAVAFGVTMYIAEKTLFTSTNYFEIPTTPPSDSLKKIASATIGTATSGRRCKLIKSRTYDHKDLLFPIDGKKPIMKSNPQQQKSLESFKVNKKCHYWATLTTIFNATEAVLNMPKTWCLVVAADKKGPKEEDYVVGPNTVLLTVEKQQELESQFEFVNNLPWNHFARKNVAYLFAIMNGAEWIWDFDDDNILYETPYMEKYQDGIFYEPKNKSACTALNPYRLNAAKGSAVERMWPRGYPLELINSPACHTTTKCIVKKPSIGIYQSFADGDPDVDAIYRLTQELPVFFDKTTSVTPILVPNGMLSPMNAQAALVHVSLASWSLYLPTTVHGRVSDIWRSYIAQTVGRYYGLQTAFLPNPWVRQDRNVHDYLSDFNSEIPLYECAGALVTFLNEWYPPENTSLPNALILLYIELYEYGIIEYKDVTLIQQWITSLLVAGYQFPTWDVVGNKYTVDNNNDNDAVSCTPYVVATKTTSDSTTTTTRTTSAAAKTKKRTTVSAAAAAATATVVDSNDQNY